MQKHKQDREYQGRDRKRTAHARRATINRKQERAMKIAPLRAK